MIITNAAYIAVSSFPGTAPVLTVNVIMDGEEINIPLDEGNRHYTELMRQVNEEGLVIKPYVEPV